MENAMEPGRITFDDKIKVRKTIEEGGIPFTYVSANCFAGYFLGGLYDIATYTIKAIDDPRTLNKSLYIRPPKNILSQRQVVQVWKKLIGKELQKSSISKEEFLTAMKASWVDTYYHVCYEGCLTNFEIG
ncbi:hypothetical protein ACOSQ2_014054 [Xanthoceras sorbifolium]